MRFKSLVLSLLLIPVSSFACDCVGPNQINPTPEAQKYARENSECILIGQVRLIDRKKQLFEIEIIESLDGGDVQGNIYSGKGWKYCEPYIEHNGFWLIYGYTEKGYLRPHICGLSRSFDMFSFKQINSYNKAVYKPEQDSIYKGIRRDFINSLRLEINALRQKKKKI